MPDRTVQPRVYLERDAARKRKLQEHLTALLPQWFGRPDSNAIYAHQAESLDGYVAELDRIQCGLLLLKTHSPISAEIYWMGVDPGLHRQGIGRALVDAATEAAARKGIKYLFVATLHPDNVYEPYERTRRFYTAMGFAYVLEDQFSADPETPIAFYMKQII